MKLSPELRRALLVFVAMVFLVSLVWFVKNGNVNNIKTYEFTGTLQGIDNNTLAVSGIYTIEEEIQNNQPQEPRTVNIIVSRDTKITRRLITLPTQEELDKNEGRFEPDNLPYVESQVDFDTLKNDSKNSSLGIFAKSERNIFNITTFNASELNYRTVARPQ